MCCEEYGEGVLGGCVKMMCYDGVVGGCCGRMC